MRGAPRLTDLDERLSAALFPVGGETITRWMLLGWGAGVYCLVLAWLLRMRKIAAEDFTRDSRKRGAEWATATCVAAGTFLWCMTAAAGLHSDGPLTLMWLAWVAGVLGFGRVTVTAERAIIVETAAAAVLVAAGMKWFIYDGLVQSVSDNGAAPGSAAHGAVPFFNLFVLNGLLFLAGFAGARRTLRAGVGGSRVVDRGDWFCDVEHRGAARDRLLAARHRAASGRIGRSVDS